jgi:hypothetical protein
MPVQPGRMLLYAASCFIHVYAAAGFCHQSVTTGRCCDLLASAVKLPLTCMITTDLHGRMTLLFLLAYMLVFCVVTFYIIGVGFSGFCEYSLLQHMASTLHEHCYCGWLPPCCALLVIEAYAAAWQVCAYICCASGDSLAGSHRNICGISRV